VPTRPWQKIRKDLKPEDLKPEDLKPEDLKPEDLRLTEELPRRTARAQQSPIGDAQLFDLIFPTLLESWKVRDSWLALSSNIFRCW